MEGIVGTIQDALAGAGLSLTSVAALIVVFAATKKVVKLVAGVAFIVALVLAANHFGFLSTDVVCSWVQGAVGDFGGSAVKAIQGLA